MKLRVQGTNEHRVLVDDSVLLRWVAGRYSLQLFVQGLGRLDIGEEEVILTVLVDKILLNIVKRIEGLP